MAINENWQRWTYATYAKSLLADAAAATPAIPIIAEFFNTKPTDAWEVAATKAEATISGPSALKVSPTRYKLTVSVFIVVSTKVTTNNYGHLNAVGALQAALSKCFLVKDYGDTGLLEIGVFTLTDDADGVTVDHIKPKKNDSQIHTTLFAQYDGNF